MRNPDQKALPAGAAAAPQKHRLIEYFRQPSIQAELAKVMPSHMRPERMMKVLLAAMMKTPKLLECDQTSMYQAAMQLSELALEPNSPFGHAYLIPFENRRVSPARMEVQVIIGYRGYIELARRTGKMKNIRARVRRDEEPFEIKLGLHEELRHEYRGDTSKPMTHVYCVAEFTDGSYYFEVMTRSEVEAIRQRSKSKDSGPWKDDFEEMAKKTVVRRASKYWPLSAELAEAIALDEQDVIEGAALRTVAPPVPVEAPPAAAEQPESGEYEVPDEKGVLPDPTPAQKLKLELEGAPTGRALDVMAKRIDEIAPKGSPDREPLSQALLARRKQLMGGG